MRPSQAASRQAYHRQRTGLLRRVTVVTAIFALGVALTAVSSANAQDPSTAPASDDVSQLVQRFPAFSYDEAKRYLDLTDPVDRLADVLVAKYPDSYAGLWRDIESGTSDVSVAFTSTPSDLQSTIEGVFPEPDLIHIIEAKRSLATLKDRSDALGALLADSSLADRMVYVGIGMQRNDLEVALTGPVTSADRAAVQALMPGTAMTVIPQAPLQATTCTSRYHCTPQIRGGIELLATNLGLCSSGFIGKSLSTGSWVAFTAGHCFPVGTQVLHGDPGHDTPKLVGAVENRRFGTDTDGETVQFTVGVLGWQNSRWVYESETNRTQVIGSVEGWHFHAQVNDFVCKAGITTGRTCGNITQTSATVKIDGTTFTNQVVARLCARAGDSGGAVHLGGKAFGVQSASSVKDPGVPCNSTNIATWSHMRTIENAVNARINVGQF